VFVFVTQNDALLRLPSQTSADASSCVPCHGPDLGRGSDDGPEEVITADDYVRQRMAAVNASRPEPTQPSNNSPPVARWRKHRRTTSVRLPFTAFQLTLVISGGARTSRSFPDHEGCKEQIIRCEAARPERAE